MSYFRKTETYQTYFGEEFDFHYDFNANSGGGQAFLGGKASNALGNAIAASSLEGFEASFSLCCRDRLIGLDDNGNGLYDISPRGAGSQSMKLGVQGKVNPNLLITAALMLPKTCGRNMATSITVSPLTTDNYWLRSMWLEVNIEDSKRAVFIPKDLVYEGGLSKRQSVTTEKDKVIGEQQFFKLDYKKRIEDIIALSSKSELPGYARDALSIFSGIYLGTNIFEFERCSSTISELMIRLSQDYCEDYSGYSDPLDFLLRLTGYEIKLRSISNKRTEPNSEPRNLIYFGAPGTGKSYNLNKRVHEEFDDDKVRRVTFHPDYTYAQFVGSFKPYSDPNKGNEITYKYVTGAFLDTYLAAITHPDDKYVLVIEELNRANPAAVFGNIFQLLDRDSSGNSEYSVATSTEMADCINEYLSNLTEDEVDAIECYYDPDLDFEGFSETSSAQLSIPDNMYIWATMNSADQGVYPMDTAFKRRWDFKYLGIDEGENAVADAIVPIGEKGKTASWNELRKAINRKLLDAKVNEDKLIGPFFIAPTVLRDPAKFNDVFKSKVLLYLYEDAAKTKRSTLFKDGTSTYFEICKKYDEEGPNGIFSEMALDYVVNEDADADIDDNDDSE